MSSSSMERKAIREQRQDVWPSCPLGFCSRRTVRAVGAMENPAALVSLGQGYVVSPSPKSRTVFTASLKERHRGIRIYRGLSGTAPPNAFRFDPDLQTARLSPPAPFSGSASLARSKDSFSPIWAGDLTVDFPGRPTVALTGSGIHASIVHARFTQSSGPSAEIGF